MGRKYRDISTMTPATKMMGLVITSLTLFSMFFGAGNLIFPPMMGAAAGDAFPFAIAGFLIGGVALPVISLIAVAVAGADIRDLAGRGGVVFGVLFSVVVYLSVGAFYALPRTGAVSFATAITPITGWDSTAASVAYNAVFFGIALTLSFNPNRIVDNLGKVLTPALITLLVVLVWKAVTVLPVPERAASGDYAGAPLSSGLLAGYMTMDSLASLAFGIVVVSSLNYRGISGRKATLRGTSFAAVVAGLLLGAIYVGLGMIGRIIPNPEKYSDGAALLADAARIVLGSAGQIVLALIVVLACMTTAVGLLASSSQFFARLIPGVPYRSWLVGFTIISFTFASAGLQTILSIAGPVIGLIYPIAITVVFATLLGAAFTRIDTGRAFRCSAWVATFWSLAIVLGDHWFPQILPAINWVPLHAAGFGWVCPVIAAYALGFVLRRK